MNNVTGIASPARPRLALVVVALVGLTFLARPPVGAQEATPDPAEGEFLLARDALAARNYAEAVVLLGRFEKGHPTSSLVPEARLLTARAYYLWGKADEATQALMRFIDDNPGDPWATRARLLLADVFLAQKRFQDASEVYRARLDFLHGDAYLATLSAAYLEIADPAYDGRKVQDPSSVLPKEILQRDFATALKYYEKARSIYLPPGRQGEILFRIGRSLLELHRDAEAVAELRWLLSGAAGAAGAGTPPPELGSDLRGEATFSLATSLYRTGAKEEAIAEFLRLESELADHRWVPEAVERVGAIRLELAAAAATDSERRARFSEALEAWDRLLARYPQHELAPKVAYARASALARFGDIEGAVVAFAELPRRFPKDPKAPDAVLQVAELERARNAFDAAIAAWKSFLGTYPNDSRWSSAQQAIVRARYDKGVHLLQVEKKPELAREVWTSFLEEYPLDALAPEVYRRFYEMALPAGPDGAPLPAEGPVVADETARAKLLAAIGHLRTLFGKYPESPLAPSSRLLAAHILHHRLDDLEAAIAEYEALVAAYAGHNEAAAAQATLASLRRKHLKVTTPRAFTTALPWRLEVETRNVARLRFKAYRLNLEEYFRRKHAVEAVEDVVVGVVEPSKTWEADVPAYRPFRLLGGVRELPLDAQEAGAYIVTVEDVPPVTVTPSATAPEPAAGPPELLADAGPPLLATTLVVRSDLAFVTKHSQSGTLVWTFDERNGAPAAGARVLLSSPSGLVAEGKTDAQGIWRHVRPGASGLGEVRVMAILEATGGAKGSHFAVDRAAAAAVASYGYTTKVHVATDRPLYRPEQTVHFRAILRKATDGRYESSEGEKALVTVRNPRGVILYEEEHTADEFGTIDGEVELTDEPPLGDYQVSVRYRDLDFAAAFKVEEYRKPEFAVSLETDRATYLPGEEVTGSITAEYLFGAPVAGASVAYQVYEGPFAFDRGRFEEFRWFFAAREKVESGVEGFRFVAEGTGVTDAAGKMPFAFRPPPGSAGRTYRVLIEATDLSKITVNGAGSVIVSREGIYVVARADRKVYRPGDNATVSFRTVDAAARPVDASGDLVLLRRRAGERDAQLDEVVRTQAFATQGGLAETSIVLEKPGEYRVVLRTKDRAGTLCEGGAVLRVAGDEPDLRKEARLLAGKAVYRQGEEATLYLNSPVTGRHALLTFEGADVIDHRVLAVSAHSQEIAAKMKAEYSPNVHVAVAIPSGNTLYEASDEVIVLQFLNVALRPSSDVLAPGDEVEIEVEATDQGGAPVEAEVALAVVDRSIFELEPDRTEAIKPYFYDQRRARGVAGSASYSFRYDGATRAVESEVLEEYFARAPGEDGGDSRRMRLAGLANAPRPEKPGALAPAATAGAEPAGAEADRQQARGAFKRKSEELEKSAEGRRRELLEAKVADKKDGLAGAEDDLLERAEEEGPGAAFGLELGRLWRFDEATMAPAGGAAALVMPTIRRTFADTAYWSPAVRTGRDGKARVKLKLPDNLTAWRVASAGATKGTLFGEGEASFRTAKKLLVRLQTPRFLTRADRTTVASPVHNYLDAVQDVRLELAAKGLDVKSFAETTLRVGAGEARAVEWELAPPPASKDALHSGLLTVRALTGRESDALEHLIPILPFGKRHAGGDGGMLLDRAVYDYELPADLVPGAASVRVDIYPHYSDALLDTVLYLRHFPYGCVEQTVSGFLPAVALQEALDRLGTPREDLRNLLEGLVPKRIVKLLNLQRPSGGWGWWGIESAASDPEMTALALMALEKCRLAGYRVQADRLELARRRAATLAQQQSSPDRQALLAYALALSNNAPVEALNSLYRNRERLSGYALALATLAEKTRGNHGVAAELAGLLKNRTRELADVDLAREGLKRLKSPPRVIADRPPEHPSSVEATAYALLALEAVEPGGATNRLLAEALLTLRRGIHWGTTKASAAAVTALAAHFAARAERTEATVEVAVNGEVLHTLEVGKSARQDEPKAFAIPLDKLRTGSNQIELRRRGSGSLAYAIRHEHYTIADTIAPEGKLLQVSRRYESFTPPKPVAVEPIPAPRPDPRRDPRDILTGYCEPTQIAGDGAAWLVSDTAPEPGYRVLVESRRPKAEPRLVRRAERGDKILVRLEVTAREDLEYVEIADPIAAGCEVVDDRDDRFSGVFERKEVRDEKVVFFRSNMPKGTHAITYLVRPTFPGSYRALPALAQCMYEPAIAGTSSDQPLEIVEELEGAALEARELTIDETLYRAEREYRRLGGARGAPEAIAALRERFLEIERTEHLDGPYRDLVLARLASIELAFGRHAPAIERVEELRRRNPRLIAGNGDLRALAGAYQEAGEFEQAVAYQGRLFDACYLRDREVGETYFQLGEPMRAQAYGLELTANYPDSSRVITDTFELSRRYASVQVEKTETRGGLRRKRQEALYKKAAQSLSRFTAYFPASALAPHAQFLVIDSLTRLGEPGHVVEEATKFQQRYPKSEYLDDALHAALTAEFARGRFQEVLERARELTTGLFLQPDGKQGRSEHYAAARYLTAKAHHILGELPAAVKAYEEVQGQFPDAAAALAHLTAKELRAPEFASVPLADEPAVDFEWKNLAKLEVKVYRVDLPLLFAVRKDLRSVSAIDLTGIDPVTRFEVKLDGKPYVAANTRVPIAAKEKGVYLVAAQAEGKETSTVLIRSDLKLEVQRLGETLRVHVQPRGAAKIKVSDGARIVAKGDADARGIFEAAVAPGRASILAERDGHFALYTE